MYDNDLNQDIFNEKMTPEEAAKGCLYVFCTFILIGVISFIFILISQIL